MFALFSKSFILKRIFEMLFEALRKVIFFFFNVFDSPLFCHVMMAMHVEFLRKNPVLLKQPSNNLRDIF